MNRVKLTFYLIFAVICILMQTTFSNAITFWGIKANLILVLVICISITDGPITGAIFGFILGLFADFYGSGLFSFNSITFTLLGAGCGFLRKKYFVGNHYVASSITLIASLIYGILFYLLCVHMRYDSAVFFSIFRRVLPECFFNTVSAVIIYPFVHIFTPKITSPI